MRHPSAKEHYQSEKNFKNVLSLILGTLFRGVRFKYSLPNLLAKTKRPQGRKKNRFENTFCNSKACFKNKNKGSIKKLKKKKTAKKPTI